MTDITRDPLLRPELARSAEPSIAEVAYRKVGLRLLPFLCSATSSTSSTGSTSASPSCR